MDAIHLLINSLQGNLYCYDKILYLVLDDGSPGLLEAVDGIGLQPGNYGFEGGEVLEHPQFL